jgi:Uma2 family endonuclease
MLLLDRPASEVLHTSLTLADYLALPEDTRCEIVDGILRPMATPSDVHREVQFQLVGRLKQQRPKELRVSWELSVIFQIVPPTAYVPDTLVYRPRLPRTSTNSVPSSDVLIMAEVVSPGSETNDRLYKPAHYALNGIPHYWRIELEPDIEVHTYHLSESVYEQAGVFGHGARLTDPGLPWLNIEVDGLLGDIA